MTDNSRKILDGTLIGGMITGFVSLMAYAMLHPTDESDIRIETHREPERRTNYFRNSRPSNSNQSAKFTAIDKLRKWGKAETFDSNKVKYASDIFNIAEDSGDSAVIRYAIDALSDISESCTFSSSSGSINNMIVKLGRM